MLDTAAKRTASENFGSNLRSLCRPQGLQIMTEALSALAQLQTIIALFEKELKSRTTNIAIDECA